MKIKSLFVLGIILIIVGYLFFKSPIDEKIERIVKYDIMEKAGR